MSEGMNPRASTGGLPRELAVVERMLNGVRPARVSGLDRDQVMYEAGRAAARRAGRARLRLWQGTCAALLVASLSLTAGLTHRSGVKDVPTVAQTHETLAPGPQIPSLGIATPASGGSGDDWADIAHAGLRPGTLTSLMTGTTLGGSQGVPALKKGDGLDALPNWQRQAAQEKGPQ